MFPRTSCPAALVIPQPGHATPVHLANPQIVGLESDGLTVANTMAATNGITSSDPRPSRPLVASNVVTLCWQRGR
jgi:hypothetical protein